MVEVEVDVRWSDVGWTDVAEIVGGGAGGSGTATAMASAGSVARQTISRGSTTPKIMPEAGAEIAA